jgi:uncharacterized glyoxalase superfamily protein PhnB
MCPEEKQTMTGIEKVTTITLAVRDQEEALQWFTEKLDFEKRTDLTGTAMRWLTIAPKKQTEIEFVLASWFPDCVGKNAPCVVVTADCRGTYETLQRRGVTFVQKPTEKPYGVEAVFQDLYGNSYALVERDT